MLNAACNPLEKHAKQHQFAIINRQHLQRWLRFFKRGGGTICRTCFAARVPKLLPVNSVCPRKGGQTTTSDLDLKLSYWLNFHSFPKDSTVRMWPAIHFSHSAASTIAMSSSEAQAKKRQSSLLLTPLPLPFRFQCWSSQHALPHSLYLRG